MSNKQIFSINRDEDGIYIEKASSCVNKNKSTMMMFLKNQFGSSPSFTDINNFLIDTLKELSK